MPRTPTAQPVTSVIARGHLQANRLLTDGLSPCLTAGTRPSFSWQLVQPEESDPSRARQTGYEIVVQDAAGSRVWNSGQVASDCPVSAA